MINLKMFTGHAMTAADDAIIYNSLINASGIISGCELSFLGANQVLISSGKGIIKGRLFEIEEETLYVALSDTEETMKGRLYLHMDLSDVEEPLKIMSVAAAELPDLLRDEKCNYTAGIYEVELARYTAETTKIAEFQSTYIIVKGIDVLDTIEEIEANTESGKCAGALAVKQINSNIAIRYNPETDYIQCFYNGEWHDVYNAKIKWNGYLIKDGVVDTEHWGELIAVGAKGVSEKYLTLDNHTADASVELLSGYISMNIKMGSEYYRAGNFYGLKKVQLDNFSNIKLQFKLVHGEANADTIQKTTSVVLFASNTIPNDNSFLDFGIKSRIVNVGSVSSLTMLELNVENLTGEYYIGINFNGYSNESVTHKLLVYNLSMT